jgi:hypothetical protein
MKILTDKITLETDLPLEKVISIFHEEILTEFRIFPDRIMTGEIKNGNIDSLINPPSGFVDPFKSRVNGTVQIANKLTRIELKISTGWIIIGFYILWYSIILIVIFGYIFGDAQGNYSGLLFLIAFAIFPIGLGRLKLNWDKKRLEDWIREKIENSAQQSI